MNPGLDIFKLAQRLQGGTENVYHRDELFFRPGHKPSPKEASRLYDPGEQSDEDYNAAYEAHERDLQEADEDDLAAMAKEQPGAWKPDSYKTIGIEIDGKEVEIPQWGGMTPIQAENMARMRLEWNLDPFATDEELEKVQNAAHQGPDDARALPEQYDNPDRYKRHYAEGTSNVGLGIFKNAQRFAEGVNNVGLAPGRAPWDYFNPWGGTTKGGSGTGIPTQKVIGTGVGTASNFIIPGSGYFTGPFARWITSMIQHGMSRQQAHAVAQQAVQAHQAKAPSTTQGGEDSPGSDTGTNDNGAGGGDGGYYKPDYLKSIGYGPGQGKGSLWPGSTGNWGYNQDNPDSPFYDDKGPAAGGFSGGIGGGGGSFFHQTPGSRATSIAGATAGLGAGGGGYLGGNYGGGSALWNRSAPVGQSEFGQAMKFIPGYTNNLSYGDYTDMWNQMRAANTAGASQAAPEPGAVNTQGAFHGGQRIMARQTGDSNVGLNIFRRKQMLKKPKTL